MIFDLINIIFLNNYETDAILSIAIDDFSMVATNLSQGFSLFYLHNCSMKWTKMDEILFNNVVYLVL